MDGHSLAWLKKEKFARLWHKFHKKLAILFIIFGSTNAVGQGNWL
jgi:hypothetical protein